MSDRTVHGITSNGWEIVRYDRAGKWYCEKFSDTDRDNERHLLTLEVAVMSLTGSNDQVFLGLPGGRTFDARVRRARFAAGHEEI